MNGNERREKIAEILKNSSKAVSGSALAKELGVSRQVIVTDIALLRANGLDVLSTISGYVLNTETGVTRVFKVQHSDDQVREELDIFVDYGCTVEDVFVYHKVYGKVKAELNISTRADVEAFLKDIASGKSSLLKNVTSGYHYHTVSAGSEAILDAVMQKLWEKGFLAALQDYEPDDIKR